MKLFPLACLLALPLLAADIDVAGTLKRVEERYNSARSLQLNFTETYQQHGRKLMESGELFLRKPGKMRWQYTAPAGKLFISDGKFIYSYLPEENRAEKTKLKETEDMRAPLAFLLGELDFNKDFREFRARPEDGGTFITALPKSDKMPYSEVSFLTGPDAMIRRLIVKSQDNSLLEFTFSNEKKNAAVSDSEFQFALPKGAEFVDLSNER